MRISLISLKVSLAGAKLSHLVKKNRAWDHGSMVEQVKAVFMQLQKFPGKGNEAIVKKYLTASAYELFKYKMGADPKTGKTFLYTQTDLQDIDIIEVHEGKKNQPNHFVALIKGRQKVFVRNNEDKITTGQVINYQDVEFKVKWFFVLEGEWWLLNEMKN